MDLQLVDFPALSRMALLFLHLLAMIAAGAGIAFGDYALFARRRMDTVLLQQAGHVVTLALLMLWATGLAVIWLDTGFHWEQLAATPKLLAKLTVVGLLSLNGIALHGVVFGRLCRHEGQRHTSLLMPATLGAISLVSWLYAAFVGLAGPAAALLGYAGFMLLYSAALLAGVVTSLCLVPPRLADRLGQQRLEG